MEEILKKISTGAFAGIQMLNIARRVLEASDVNRLFVTCETYNRLPDPFQVLAGATIGNKGSIARSGKNSSVSPPPCLVHENRKSPTFRGVPILLSAVERVYSWKIMDLDVPEKPGNKIAICERCIESFIQNDDAALCVACLDGLHHS